MDRPGKRVGGKGAVTPWSRHGVESPPGGGGGGGGGGGRAIAGWGRVG